MTIETWNLFGHCRNFILGPWTFSGTLRLDFWKGIFGGERSEFLKSPRTSGNQSQGSFSTLEKLSAGGVTLFSGPGSFGVRIAWPKNVVCANNVNTTASLCNWADRNPPRRTKRVIEAAQWPWCVEFHKIHGSDWLGWLRSRKPFAFSFNTFFCFTNFAVMTVVQPVSQTQPG